MRVDRREFFRVSSLVAGGLAAGCAPQILSPPEDASPRPTEVPRVREITLPTAEPTSAPKPEIKRQPTTEDIKIEQTFFSSCEPGPNYSDGEYLWGGWMARLNNSTYYLKDGRFEMDLFTPSGRLISSKPLPNIALSPGGIDYIPAFVEPGAKQKAMFGAGPEYFISGGGSQLGSIKLRPTGQMKWAEVDNSPKEYPWEASFLGNGFTTDLVNPYNRYYLYFPRGTRPRSFWMEFQNKGEQVINQVGVFGFLVAEGNKLADMFFGGAGKISYGKTQTFEVKSLINSGQCLVSSGGGYELLYWVSFDTHTGMPVGKFEKVHIPNW